MEAARKPSHWVRLSLWLLIIATGGCLSQPMFSKFQAWIHDDPSHVHLPAGYTDDASRQNRTKVAEVWSVPPDPMAAESQLRDLLLRAQAHQLKVAIAGARHTMGGHTIYPDGIVLDMLPFNRLELDAGTQILHVGSGARWSEIIPYLDARGFSVAIMQSNNNFSVGGSLSANCHGWQHNRPPIASTVASFRLMTADGSVVRCSRLENSELFSLVLGGYGLFGVILDVDLHVVRNERYRPEVQVFPAEQYPARFAAKVNQKEDVGMAYGRLCVTPGEKTFLREALLTVFRQSPCSDKEIPSLKASHYRTLRRDIFLAQVGSKTGKDFRWKAEKLFGEQVSGKFVSRNQLLHEEAEVYMETNPNRTDILQEYFIPPDQITAFLEKVRMIIPMHHGDLLNVTIRNVLEDKDAFLRYADQEMFGLVMLFSQARTAEADGVMAAMTQDLIGAVLACGGRYYLPYRLHATREQTYRAYPQAQAFFELKRRHDPNEIFQNKFYLKYGQN